MGIRILLHLSVVLILSPLLLGIIGKTKAFFMGRWGPPLLQVYYDIGKLFRKGNVYSATTTWIFQAAPVVSMAAVLISSILIPLGGLKAPLPFWGDVLLFAGLYGLARFFMIIAALDTGSSFEGMGASREAAFSCLAEVVLFLDFIILALLSKKFVLSEMIEENILSSWQLLGPALLLAGASYFMVLLTENARIPVDDPATHLELTMIHEVMVLDHSGWDLAYILYGSAIKFFVLGGLFVNIFIPAHDFSPLAQTAVFLGGMVILALGVGIVESCMARLRLNRVPHLLMGAFVLALVGLLVVLSKEA
ncbi:MAG TPA: NADH-quinone oxidoreductase subunit H [Candidatus Omnitrophota bacterium]|nr:NADH-quinone oxidoreductase subunit H [Candidatus Omnitrophota bacterium]